VGGPKRRNSNVGSTVILRIRECGQLRRRRRLPGSLHSPALLADSPERGY
jgi:hypothetical protein